MITGRYPSQKEWERKELLCLSRLDLLERGHCWEHAVPICKELARLYEEKLGHYDKLASILKREAKLFEQIWSSADLRPEPEYFRVVLNKEGVNTIRRYQSLSVTMQLSSSGKGVHLQGAGL